MTSHGQNLVFINSTPGNTEFLYTDKLGKKEPEPAGKGQKGVKNRLFKTYILTEVPKPKVTKEFIEMVKVQFPQYLADVEGFPRATKTDIQKYKNNNKLAKYFPESLTGATQAKKSPPKETKPEPQVSEPDEGEPQTYSMQDEPQVPQEAMRPPTRPEPVPFPGFAESPDRKRVDSMLKHTTPVKTEEQILPEEAKNEELQQALDDLAKAKNEEAIRKLAETLKAQKEGTPVMPTVTPYDPAIENDVLLSTRETDPLDLEVDPTGKGPVTAGEYLNVLNQPGGLTSAKAESVAGSDVATADGSSVAGSIGSVGSEGSEAGPKHKFLIVSTLIDSLLKTGKMTVQQFKDFAAEQEAAGLLDAEMMNYINKVVVSQYGDTSSQGSSQTSSDSGSTTQPYAVSDTGSNPPMAPGALDSATQGSEPTEPVAGTERQPETGLQNNAPSGTAAVRPENEQVKYHNTAIKLFFTDDKMPKWDLDLEFNIRDLEIPKDEVASIIDLVVDSKGPEILVSKRKSDGDIQELVEVLELHFCSMRLLAMGGRAPMAMIPLGTLIKERGILAGTNSQPSDQQDQPVQQPQSGPGDLGPFDVLDQEQAKPAAEQQQPAVSGERIPLTIPEATQKVVEAWNSRPYVNGKPMESSTTRSVKEQMTRQVAEKTIPRPQPHDLGLGLGPHPMPPSLVRSFIGRNKKRSMYGDCFGN